MTFARVVVQDLGLCFSGINNAFILVCPSNYLNSICLISQLLRIQTTKIGRGKPNNLPLKATKIVTNLVFSSLWPDKKSSENWTLFSAEGIHKIIRFFFSFFLLFVIGWLTDAGANWLTHCLLTNTRQSPAQRVLPGFFFLSIPQQCATF